MKDEIMSDPIKIKPIYVKEESALKDFKKETLEALKNLDFKIILERYKQIVSGATNLRAFKFYEYEFIL